MNKDIISVDKTGKRYNIEFDNIRGFEDDFEKYKELEKL